MEPKVRFDISLIKYIVWHQQVLKLFRIDVYFNISHCRIIEHSLWMFVWRLAIHLRKYWKDDYGIRLHTLIIVPSSTEQSALLYPRSHLQVSRPCNVVHLPCLEHKLYGHSTRFVSTLHGESELFHTMYMPDEQSGPCHPWLHRQYAPVEALTHCPLFKFW